MVGFVDFEVHMICVGLLIFTEMSISLAESEDSKPQIPWIASVKDSEPFGNKMSTRCNR